MTFDLIYNDEIKLRLNRITVQEAVDHIKQEIAGDGVWRPLRGIDPDKCLLRTTKIVHDYYDLNGNKVEPITDNKDHGIRDAWQEAFDKAHEEFRKMTMWND